MSPQAVEKSAAGKRFLILPLAVYLLLSLLYLLAVPTGESPDEPGHLQCIEQVSLLGRLPEIDPLPEGEKWWSRGKIISGRMCYHMPLYYLLAGGVQKVVATAVAEPIDYDFPPTNQNFGPNPAMFDHPVKASFWRFTDPTHLLVLRLLSIFLGGVTVWASWTVAQKLLPGRPLVALLAGLLTAVWPQFLYLSRSLNNDGLATALAVLILVVLLDVQKPRRFIWAAFLAVLALFTKLSVAYSAVAVLLVWGLEFWQYPARRPRYFRILLACLTLFAAAFVTIMVTPTLWHHFSQSSGDFATASAGVGELSYWGEVLKLSASSGWARFGWMNVAAPQWQATVWWVLLLGTAVIGLASLLKSRQKITFRLQIGIIVIWLLLVAASYLQINLNRLQPQFRFALGVVPVLTTLSAVGWFQVIKGGARRQLTLTGIIIGVIIYYNYWVIINIIAPAYRWFS